MISLGFLDEMATEGEIENFYKQELFNPDQEEIETTDLVEFHEDDVGDSGKNIAPTVSKTNEFVI
jgi:hypothetical protein